MLPTNNNHTDSDLEIYEATIHVLFVVASKIMVPWISISSWHSHLKATQWRFHELYGHFCNPCIYYSGYLHFLSVSTMPQPQKTSALQALNLLMEISPLCCILFFYTALVVHDIIYKTLAHFFPWCALCGSTANELTSFNKTPFWHVLTAS